MSVRLKRWSIESSSPFWRSGPKIQVGKACPWQIDAELRHRGEDRRRQRPAGRWVGGGVRVERRRQWCEVDLLSSVVHVERGAQHVVFCRTVPRYATSHAVSDSGSRGGLRPSSQRAVRSRRRAPATETVRRLDGRSGRGSSGARRPEIDWGHNRHVEIIVDHRGRSERAVERDPQRVVWTHLVHRGQPW